jgi:hypothetical protein
MGFCSHCQGGILVRYRDASLVVLAPAWAAPQPLVIPPIWTSPLSSRPGVGRIRCPQAKLDAVLWGVAPDAGRQLAGWDQLRSPSAALQEASQDRLLLTNGDLLSGRLESIAAPAPRVESAAELQGAQRRESTGDAEIVFQSELGTLELSSDRVRGLALARELPVGQRTAPLATTAAATPTGASPAELPKFRVGLSDGTLLAVYDADATARGLRLMTCCGEQTPEVPWGKVVFLAAEGRLPPPTGRGLLRVVADQTLRTELRPYLFWGREDQWNRSVLGGPLVVGGTAICTASVPPPRFAGELAIPAGSRKFAAEVAIDDAAGEGGSVVFAVLLQAADGAWREAYRSRVVRGGERPLTVRVPLSGEVAAALTTEFASRGDELDYADWLDPRWE